MISDELARSGDARREGETIGPPDAIDAAGPNAKHAAPRRTVLDLYAGAAIRLLILTGARLREILDAQWQHVDFKRGVIFLPDSKTGRKTLYLNAAALEVLSSLPRIEGNPHIIAGVKGGARGPEKAMGCPHASGGD
ncbi:MAG: tyrosine-type recombinase/integrase [Methylocella sp.]